MIPKKIFIPIVFSLLTACESWLEPRPLSFDPGKRLYTSDQAGHPISDLPGLLDKLLKDKPVILFVHGRGKEPNKSLRREKGRWVEGMAVRKLEEEYGANVLMFNWDSKKESGHLFDRSRPLSKMLAASQAFKQLLNGIKQYRKDNPQSCPISLLTHSMGSIVIETMVAKWGWIDNGEKPLFSNIVLSASDSDDKGHTDWVEKISASENVYVTINADDRVLKKSNHKRPTGAAALGLEPGEKLAKKAIYIDVTKLGSEEGKKAKRHELFKKSKMHDQIHVCSFFQQSLTEDRVLLNPQNLTEVVPEQRYKLEFERDNTNDCFFGGAQESERAKCDDSR